jgi:predicted GNAT family acetyltransferase
MDERALMAERSTFDFDWRPADFASIDRPDVYAWSYTGGWAGSRGVGRATWRDRELASRLPEIAAFFARHARSIRWYVGPSTTSRELVRILKERTTELHEPRLMSIAIPDARLRISDAVEIRRVTAGPLVREIIEAAFPEFTPDRREASIIECDAYLSGGRRGGRLAAFIDGELVGFASWRDAGDGGSLQLVGAWTKPSQRGRGVYSTLTAFRLARARERGLGVAVIVADPTTSAPIVAKAGFADHGPLLIFRDVRL